jgi:hypothetical protein
MIFLKLDLILRWQEMIHLSTFDLHSRPNMKWDTPNKINFLTFLVILVLNVTIKTNHTLWQTFSDSYDYIAQSKIPITSSEFYFPTKKANFYPRPFTVPLFYKLFSGDPDRIIPAQFFFHTFSTFCLVVSLLMFIKRNYIKYLLIFFIYALMSWWNVLGWSGIVLSESVSTSFMMLWMASFLLLLRKRTTGYLILHIVIAIFFSFTRDSWLYFLPPFYCLVALLSFLWDKSILKQCLILLSFSIVLFTFQNYAVSKGNRHRLAVLNNIVFNIMPNNKYLQWFADQGLPCIDQLKRDYSNLNMEDKKVYALYDNKAYDNLYKWIDEKGKDVYMKFLISHPAHTFLFEEDHRELKRILAYNLLEYTGKARGRSWAEYTLFLIFNLASICILALILIVLFIKRKDFILLFPVILIIMFAFNVLIIYNAEAMEVERHLIITQIAIQLIGIISSVLILDSDELNNKINIVRNKFRSVNKYKQVS